MAQQKALLLLEKQGDFAVRTRAIPTPGSGQLLIRVEAAALNPVDWKLQKSGFGLSEYPAVLGSDGAGVVEALGEGVSGFAMGDRVIFPGNLFKYDQNAYQEFALADVALAGKIPTSLSVEEAASIPTGLATAAIGLYGSKTATRGGAELFPPWVDGGIGKYAGKPIVILGGSSVVGIFAIQLAKLSGFSPIIASASPHNEDLVKFFGATHFIDRNAPLAGVRALAGLTSSLDIDIIFDAVSLPETQHAAWSLLSSSGTLVVTVNPVIQITEGETKRVVHPLGVLSTPDSRTVGLALYQNIPQWLDEGLIMPSKVEVLPRGLAGVPAGLKRLEANEVSGKKLVVKPQETA